MTLFTGSLFSLISLGAQVITVEPQVPYNVSNQDDLKLMGRFFQESTWVSSIPNKTWLTILKPLGFSKLRIMNMESKNSVSIDPSTKELDFDFSQVELKGLNNSKAYGLIPHIVVGLTPQIPLATNIKNGQYYGISDWVAYEKYAYAFLEFVMIKEDFSQADFEVGNEPDGNGMPWLLPDSVQPSDPKMYSAYMKLYGAWAHAADKLAHEHPELKLRIGGPSLTFFFYGFKRFDWVRQFTKDVVAQQLPLDFISFHYYGNSQALKGLTEFGVMPSLSKMVNYLRDNLKANGLNNIPLNLSEWGPTWHTDETPAGIINANNVGAAWMARFLLNMAEYSIDEGAFLLINDITNKKDPNHPDKLVDNWGWPSFLLADMVTPKAPYNVALMFSKLPGRRVKTMPIEQGSIGIVASADTSKVGILAFNQNWDFGTTKKDLASTKEVQINVKELPFIASKVHVVRYLVDETHSNAYYLYKNNVKPTPQNSALRKVDIKDIPVIDGTVKLPNVNLEPSSVTLWEITASK
ncbi:MAG: hypothetical protein PHY16_02835 [Methylobacter sp.]|nr:hypothetical protein [Methylobacter sp.]